MGKICLKSRFTWESLSTIPTLFRRSICQNISFAAFIEHCPTTQLENSTSDWNSVVVSKVTADTSGLGPYDAYCQHIIA